MDIQNIKNRFGIIGNSPALNHALSTAIQVANTDLTVLIVGESGVGKEVFSNIIHSLSPRKHNPFIAVNCGAIPEGTIDSELFGHEKGAFTGAVDSRKGYFETVNGGTIFLDEIGEMPLGTQARLLRVLETGEFIRVGSSKVQKTDVRVIAATNKDLLEFTQQGKFREDLYYRLSTVPIRVPSLRDRKEDIPLLFRKFASDFSERYRTQTIQLDPLAVQMLINYPWNGNVRELKNIAEQASVLAKDKLLRAEDFESFLPKNDARSISLLPAIAGGGATSNSFSGSERDILYKLFFDLKKDLNDMKQMMLELAHRQNGVSQGSVSETILPSFSMPTENVPLSTSSFNNSPAPIYLPAEQRMDQHEDVEESLMLADREKDFIVKALKKHKGRRRDAAKELGISERTLYRKIKEYDIAE
ncbi:MAG: sigma-54-dependent Fis family transcriptional regulator [Bacteroidetes bacterium]|nr:sigma-54-dependent Fis family transcriptional regulator [Bacteroidota bacterium]MBS1740451.1 sigma-54-dependent Fis family transcriptional regulator [Bacteroidota bacterium]